MADDPGKAGGEGGEPQDPAGGEGGGEPNTHKLERDIANRDKRIKELEEQLAAATGGQKTAEDRIAAIEEQLKAMEDERDAAKADAALAAEGCVDCELGRAALAAFGGDVAKLKEAKPFLFKQEGRATSTGGRPGGSASGSDEELVDKVLSKFK